MRVSKRKKKRKEEGARASRRRVYFSLDKILDWIEYKEAEKSAGAFHFIRILFFFVVSRTRAWNTIPPPRLPLYHIKQTPAKCMRVQYLLAPVMGQRGSTQQHQQQLMLYSKTTTQTAFRDVEAPPAMACQSHTQQKYNPKRVCPVREENKAAAKR